MEKVVLKASERKNLAKSYTNQLRRDGKVPGVFYSKSHQPFAIEVAVNSINPLVFTHETHLLSLQIEGQEELDCIVKDVQFDPVTDKVIHFDLIGLTKGETIQIEVPVVLLGSAAGVKDGGILQQSLHKIEIECLPKDMPQHVEVDVTKLKVGDSVHVGDLKLENFTMLTSEDAVIVSVVAPKAEKTDEAAAAAAAEPEVIGKGKVAGEE